MKRKPWKKVFKFIHFNSKTIAKRLTITSEKQQNMRVNSHETVKSFTYLNLKNACRFEYFALEFIFIYGIFAVTFKKKIYRF